VSQPSGWDTVCSAVESLVFSVVFEVLLLAMDPFFTRFLADIGVELALRLTPAGELVLPLVAGDMMENSEVEGSEGRGCQGMNEVSVEKSKMTKMMTFVTRQGPGEKQRC
jgi:hypothetical protein